MSRNSLEYSREYVKNTYYKITLSLRQKEELKLLAWLDEQKEWGYSYSEIARTALREYFEAEKEN